MGVLMIFVDGWGIGKKDPAVNPLFAASMTTLRSWFRGNLPSLGHRTVEGADAVVEPLDATGGIEGLPQSGTGQTTLFTGVNAARVLGRHFGPYPHSALRPLLEEHNIFRRLLRAGSSVCFANAYPRQFFEYIESGKRRLSVTTLSCRMAGVPLRGADDLRRGMALSPDLTRERWAGLGYDDIPVITPEEAGRHLARLAGAHDFTLFEFFHTDHAGHRQNMREAIAVLEKFDLFLGGLSASFPFDSATLIMTSDHGNIENIGTKPHTRNPVPLILAGDRRASLRKKIRRMEDITPAIVDLLHPGS